MASARKNYARSKAAHRALPKSERVDYACIMADVLDGTIRAERLIEVRNPQGKIVRFEYDDPQGAAPAPQNERSRRK